MTREISEYKPREPEIKYGPKKKSKLRKYAVRGGIFAAFAGVASYFVPKLLGGNNESPQNVDGPPNGPPDYLMNKNQMDPGFDLIYYGGVFIVFIIIVSLLTYCFCCSGNDPDQSPVKSKLIIIVFGLFKFICSMVILY